MIEAIIFDWVGTLFERFKAPYPFSEKVLKELKQNYKLGLVTLAGQGIKKREEDIKKSGLKSYFDSIIIDTDKGKRQYLKCMNELEVTPTQTAIVDDQATRLRVGIKLGCKTYWIRREWREFYPNKETGEPTKRINSVKDLVQVLN